MPKYKKSTERLKAKQVAKSFLKHNLNVSAVAQERGTSRQNESKLLRRKPVRDALTRMLESKKVAKKVAARLDEGLDATKVIGYLHQYKQKVKEDKDNTQVAGKVEPITPDEVISNDFLNVPDMHARHKYLMTYMQATGKIKNIAGSKDTHIHLHLTVEERNARINRLTEFYQTQN